MMSFGGYYFRIIIFSFFQIPGRLSEQLSHSVDKRLLHSTIYPVVMDGGVFIVQHQHDADDASIARIVCQSEGDEADQMCLELADQILATKGVWCFASDSTHVGTCAHM
jgi:hypothetical protein